MKKEEQKNKKSDDLTLEKVCEDWENAKNDAEEKTPSYDISRVLLEIDAIFNEIIDHLLYMKILTHKDHVYDR